MPFFLICISLYIFNFFLLIKFIIIFFFGNLDSEAFSAFALGKGWGYRKQRTQSTWILVFWYSDCQFKLMAKNYGSCIHPVLQKEEQNWNRNDCVIKELINRWIYKWQPTLVFLPGESHGLEPARLLCPWKFPGKSTGMGCCFLLQGIWSLCSQKYME